MKITLKQLNESFAPLGKFANDEALTVKQKYWLSRIAGAAEKEMQTLEKHRTDLVKKHGDEKDGNWTVPAAKMAAFQAEFDDLLTAEVDLPGDPIKLDTLPEAIKLTALDLTRLEWLICE